MKRTLFIFWDLQSWGLGFRIVWSWNFRGLRVQILFVEIWGGWKRSDEEVDDLLNHVFGECK